MDQLRNQFEKDLKTKLLYKTSGHMTEEILLLKNFKYFDEDNSDKCDVSTFFQVISKVGVLNLSEEQLIQLFEYYSGGQKYLNYKDFIGNIFNNESLKNTKMNQNAYEKEEENLNEEIQNEEKNGEQNKNEEQNEEEMDPIDELILKIRNRLAQKGLINLIKIEARFRELDENNLQELDLEQFSQICQEFDFGLSEQEMGDLFASFDREEKGMINYDDFIRILRGELNEKRKQLIQNVFKHLDVDNKGELSIDELLNLYIPQQSLEFIKEGKTEEEAMKIFEESFRGNHKYINGDESDTKLVDVEEFEDFYESVSLMIPNDELFREIVLKTWGLIKEEPKKEEKVEEPQEKEEKEEKEEKPEPQNKEYEEEPQEKKEEKEEEPQENEEADKNVEKEKQEEIPQARKEKDKEKEFRKKILNEENMDLFRDKLGARGIVTVMNLPNLFRQYDRKKDKTINLNDFKEIINNSKVIMAEDEISELYNDFADKKTNLLNYDIFLKNLCPNLNQRRQNIVNEAFQKLDTENCGVIDLSDIKENFNSKNCPLVRASMMSEEAFFNGFIETFQTHHNIFRSAKIKKVNFDEFEDYYKYLSITIDDDYLFEETLITSWKLSKDAIAHAGPKDNIKDIIGNPELEKPNNETAFKANYKSSKKCFPQKNKIAPYGVDDKVTDYSNDLHPKGELNGVKLSKNEDCVSFFKKKII